jgi:hypothetical protein
MKHAEQKLSRLMPYDEWCRTVNPTETAKEMYEFVRLTLQRELERSRRAVGDAVEGESGGRRCRARPS